MKTSLDDWLIGDPHMGRVFKKGVPLHRRGDRARMQMEQLRAELLVSCRMNVMVGDLFDEWIVDDRVVHEVADAYEEAAAQFPDRLFIVMAGNHDLPRQAVDPKTGKPNRGSFHALARMLGHVHNIVVVFEPVIIADTAFFPWQWEVTAKDQVDALGGSYSNAIGHWDLVDFGGNTDHLCPVDELVVHGAVDIYSGHYHVAGQYGMVQCTGSMQPYSHAEDPSETSYRTLTLDELERIDPADLRDLNLRVRLAPGETLPMIDCLSLTSIKEGEAETVEFDEVGIGDFDLSVVLGQRFEELEVPTKVQTFIREKLGAID